MKVEHVCLSPRNDVLGADCAAISSYDLQSKDFSHSLLKMSTSEIHPYMFKLKLNLNYESGKHKQHMQKPQLLRKALANFKMPDIITVYITENDKKHNMSPFMLCFISLKTLPVKIFQAEITFAKSV